MFQKYDAGLERAAMDYHIILMHKLKMEKKMQDLSKIEQEHLQANDVGDFRYTYKLTEDFAKKFSAGLRTKIIQAASAYFFASGMDDMLSSSEKAECIRLLHEHISDAVGDMPIWDIVKRGEA